MRLLLFFIFVYYGKFRLCVAHTIFTESSIFILLLQQNEQISYNNETNIGTFFWIQLFHISNFYNHQIDTLISSSNRNVLLFCVIKIFKPGYTPMRILLFVYSVRSLLYNSKCRCTFEN